MRTEVCSTSSCTCVHCASLFLFATCIISALSCSAFLLSYSHCDLKTAYSCTLSQLIIVGKLIAISRQLGNGKGGNKGKSDISATSTGIFVLLVNLAARLGLVSATLNNLSGFILQNQNSSAPTLCDGNHISTLQHTPLSTH